MKREPKEKRTKAKCLDCPRMVKSPFIRCKPHHFAHLNKIRREAKEEIDARFENAIAK